MITTSSLLMHAFVSVTCKALSCVSEGELVSHLRNFSIRYLDRRYRCDIAYLDKYELSESLHDFIAHTGAGMLHMRRWRRHHCPFLD